MKNIISRGHNFENILNWVKRGRKYFYLAHEKDSEKQAIRVLRSPRLDEAFASENWEQFEIAEELSWQKY